MFVLIGNEGTIISQIKLKKELLKKMCKKCGAKCCKPTLISIPSHINLCQGDFTNLFEQGYWGCLGISPTRNILSFIIRPHLFGHCPFLDYDTCECMIYENRPLVCRNFPFDPLNRLEMEQFCLLAKNLGEKKIQTIRNKLLIKYNTFKSQQERERKDYMDQTLFHTQFTPMINQIILSSKFITDNQGTYVIFGDYSKSHLVEALLGMIGEYSKFFKQKQVMFSIMILNHNYRPVYLLRGIYGSKETFTETQLMEILDQKGNEYFHNVFDGSALEGIIFEKEIEEGIEKWKKTWEEQKQAFSKFPFRVKNRKND